MYLKTIEFAGRKSDQTAFLGNATQISIMTALKVPATHQTLTY